MTGRELRPAAADPDPTAYQHRPLQVIYDAVLAKAAGESYDEEALSRAVMVAGAAGLINAGLDIDTAMGAVDQALSHGGIRITLANDELVITMGEGTDARKEGTPMGTVDLKAVAARAQAASLAGKPLEVDWDEYGALKRMPDNWEQLDDATREAWERALAERHSYSPQAYPQSLLDGWINGLPVIIKTAPLDADEPGEQL